MAVLLDIKIAFYTVWWPSILQELREMKCLVDIYMLVSSYLENRKLVRQEDENRVKKETDLGCLQGLVLGPIFWILIFYKVLKKVREKRILSVNYVDDQMAIIEGQSRREL